ncbi:YfiR family protein [Bordetella sp. LUAb4]|uniref:YfiR family protein n=1 Tax=Bordetella sp. LUAb4 TaxID=2843195 RepID=UPI001E471BEA|nr:YfiR family protein [Bordetella sp. LUAb4]
MSRVACCGLSLGLFFGWPATRAADAPGQEDPTSSSVASAEARAVAQVVTGILGYARWPTPPQPQPPLLCVTGSSPYSAALLAGDESVATVRARRVAPEDARLAQMCEALYVGDLPPALAAHLLQGVIGRPVVTILEHDLDCGRGMFCLDIQNGQVGFQINLDIIARSGVRIHPSVLQLARRKPQS